VASVMLPPQSLTVEMLDPAAGVMVKVVVASWFTLLVMVTGEELPSTVLVSTVPPPDHVRALRVTV